MTTCCDSTSSASPGCAAPHDEPDRRASGGRLCLVGALALAGTGCQRFFDGNDQEARPVPGTSTTEGGKGGAGEGSAPKTDVGRVVASATAADGNTSLLIDLYEVKFFDDGVNNLPGGDSNLGSFTTDGVYAVDEVNKKKYPVARDSNKRCVLDRLGRHPRGAGPDRRAESVQGSRPRPEPLDIDFGVTDLVLSVESLDSSVSDAESVTEVQTRWPPTWCSSQPGRLHPGGGGRPGPGGRGHQGPGQGRGQDRRLYGLHW